jgi:PadR family transcriptional regulator PadR
MVFGVNSGLLDAIVLAVVSKNAEGTYGYKITQDVRQVIEISDSSIYSVLRRLQNKNCLEAYDIEVEKRYRRYYRITDTGMLKLIWYCEEWKTYSSIIETIISEVCNIKNDKNQTYPKPRSVRY